jgi:prepilin-type N-terminal cleavage/methylation domain-containing protein
MNQQRGFTLLELMITVTLLAILVGIAYPAYTS